MFSYAGLTVTGVSPNVGSPTGGSVVTVSGTGFVEGSTSVDFGTSPAGIVIVASPTTLAATVPPGSAGSVDVTVTTPGGTSATSSDDLFAYGAPTVSSVAPNAGAPAGGSLVSVTGTGFVPGDSVNFGFLAATDVTVTSATTLLAIAPGSGVWRIRRKRDDTGYRWRFLADVGLRPLWLRCPCRDRGQPQRRPYCRRHYGHCGWLGLRTRGNSVLRDRGGHRKRREPLRHLHHRNGTGGHPRHG